MVCESPSKAQVKPRDTSRLIFSSTIKSPGNSPAVYEINLAINNWQSLRSVGYMGELRRPVHTDRRERKHGGGNGTNKSRIFGQQWVLLLDSMNGGLRPFKGHIQTGMYIRELGIG